MDKNVINRNFKNWLGGIAIGILSLHLIICFYFTFFPPAKRTLFSRIYTNQFLIGPFFTEEKVRFSTDVFISYKKDREWSPLRNYAITDYDNYLKDPLQYNALIKANYLQKLVRESYIQSRKPKAKRKNDLETLKRYVAHELVQDRTVDSIRIYYVFRRMSEDLVIDADTTWIHSYSVKDVQ